MIELSAIIGASGNPLHLKKCLNSVGFCKEIILLDLGLEKNLIAQLSTIPQLKIVTIDRKITYIEQIREESKQYASCERILFLDSDEMIPPALAQLLQEHCQSCDYMEIPRKNIILGKWIQHSRWWPDYQIRVFKKDKLTWPVRLHVQPEVSGEKYVVPAEEKYAIEHHNYESIDDYIARMMRYAKTEATEKMKESKTYELKHAVSEGLQEYVSRYFAAEGYRDGMHGLLLAFLQMVYKLLVYFYMWEMRGYKDEENKNIIKAADQFFSSGYYETSHWLAVKNLISQGEKLKRKITTFYLK